MEPNLRRGYNVAVKCLRKCYTEKGIMAGTTHYSNYWSGDGFFASFGACALGDFQIVKKEINLFLSKQRDDGMLPLRIGQENMLLGFAGFKMNDGTPVYREDKAGHTPMFQNSLLIMAACNYIRKSGDKTFARQILPKLEKTIAWYQPRGHLLEEKPYSTWADAVKKQGRVLYTNVLFCRALYDMHLLSAMLGKKSDFFERYEETKRAINRHFWSGKYYYDWIDKEKEKYFPVPENMLAVLLGIADHSRSESIIEEAEDMDAGFTVWNVRPKYKRKHRSPFLEIAGMADYQDGLLWLWPGCLYALALKKLMRDPVPIMERISRKINEYGTVYEIYNPDGTPVKRRLYTTEKDFAWSSGMFVYAFNEIFKGQH